MIQKQKVTNVSVHLRIMRLLLHFLTFFATLTNENRLSDSRQIYPVRCKVFDEEKEKIYVYKFKIKRYKKINGIVY